MQKKRVTYESIPVWLIDDDCTQGEHDGHPWWTNGHVLIRLDGGRVHEPDFRIPELLTGAAVANATERLTPGAAVIQVPGFSADDLNEVDGPGAETTHYKVPMGPGLWAGLSYVAIVEYLYEGVEWFGRGSFEPMVAQKDGEMVAVLMPAPLVLAYLGGACAPTETK